LLGSYFLIKPIFLFCTAHRHNCNKIAPTFQELVYPVYKLVYRKTIYPVMPQVACVCAGKPKVDNEDELRELAACTCDVAGMSQEADQR